MTQVQRRSLGGVKTIALAKAVNIDVLEMPTRRFMDNVRARNLASSPLAATRSFSTILCFCLVAPLTLAAGDFNQGIEYCGDEEGRVWNECALVRLCLEINVAYVAGCVVQPL